VLDLKHGQRVGGTVPVPFARRCRAKLSGDTLAELPDWKTEEAESGNC